MAHDTEFEEREDSLWILTVSPVIWAAHFMLSYLTAAVWCAKMGAGLAPVRLAILIYTAAALVAIGVTGWRAFRMHSVGSATTPHDFDTREDRHRFLGFATLLLSSLSAIAVFYQGLVIVFFERCA